MSHDSRRRPVASCSSCRIANRTTTLSDGSRRRAVGRQAAAGDAGWSAALMWSLAWPWVLLALPLPFIARWLLSESASLQDAGLRVPQLR